MFTLGVFADPNAPQVIQRPEQEFLFGKKVIYSIKRTVGEVFSLSGRHQRNAGFASSRRVSLHRPDAIELTLVAQTEVEDQKVDLLATQKRKRRFTRLDRADHHKRFCCFHYPRRRIEKSRVIINDQHMDRVLKDRVLGRRDGHRFSFRRRHRPTTGWSHVFRIEVLPLPADSRNRWSCSFALAADRRVALAHVRQPSF
ncbi:MAG: hypothetical protein ACI9C1_001764 [Candidatus Aldehydirespiratoraceae bacterium]